MAFLAQVLDICITKGDSYPLNFTYLDSAGDPVDITGFNLVFTVDPNPDPTSSSTNLFSLSATITDAAMGKFSVKPSAAQNTLALGTYFYDIEATIGTDIQTIANGKYIIGPQITQP
jgi:hypothetical protein